MFDIPHITVGVLFFGVGLVSIETPKDPLYKSNIWTIDGLIYFNRDLVDETGRYPSVKPLQLVNESTLMVPRRCRILIVNTTDESWKNQEGIATLYLHRFLATLDIGFRNSEPMSQLLIDISRKDGERHRGIVRRGQGRLSDLVTQFLLFFERFTKEPIAISGVLQE